MCFRREPGLPRALLAHIYSQPKPGALNHVHHCILIPPPTRHDVRFSTKTNKCAHNLLKNKRTNENQGIADATVHKDNTRTVLLSDFHSG